MANRWTGKIQTGQATIDYHHQAIIAIAQQLHLTSYDHIKRYDATEYSQKEEEQEVKKRREEKLTNETVGGRASLGVGGAISDHDNPLVAMCLLKPSDDQTLAAGA